MSGRYAKGALRVEVRTVTKTFGAIRALMGVSCAFAGGEVSVLEGPNGSGKTTLIGIVGTLVRPTSGNVSYGGVGTKRREVRERVGWVGHESLCYADLTGRENVELAARLYGRDPGAAFAWARERFGLGAFCERTVRTYSRGQRQRVALARALLHQPEIVLLDEPTAGLDAAAVDRLAAVVREEAERGAVVVVVTHDGGFAERVGHRRLRLERGRLVG